MGIWSELLGCRTGICTSYYLRDLLDHVLPICHRRLIKRGQFCKRHTPHCPVLKDVSANLGKPCFGKCKPWGSLDISVLRMTRLDPALKATRPSTISCLACLRIESTFGATFCVSGDQKRVTVFYRSPDVEKAICGKWVFPKLP